LRFQAPRQLIPLIWQVDGSFTLVFGTSASTPVVGAMLTMINDLRLTVGKNPIGFINPTVRSSALVL
jgi:tripeptidyl-peptidase-1